MKPRPTAILSGLMGALLALGASVAAQAQRVPEYRPASARELDKKDALTLALDDETPLRQDEIRSLDAMLITYVQLNGTARDLFRVIDTCVAQRCRGFCVREAVRQLNGALSDGLDAGEARQLVTAVVVRQARAAKRARWSEAELAEHVRDAGRAARADRRPGPSDDIERVRGQDDRAPAPVVKKRRRRR